ncbi:MAG: hypothetical protein K2H60_14890 [Muribaculaceae bacterium]|nr:hypothetical protein [Muribaculaceae bacterium]
MRRILNYILIAITTLGFTGCGNGGKREADRLGSPEVQQMQYAEQITIAELPPVLQRLKDGQMEYDFFGICSSPVACIYFMQEDGKFYIDYEAIGADQLPYIDKIRQYAKEQGYHVVDTTYGNTPIDFSEPAQAPVISLRVDTDIDSIAKVGARLMQIIFHNTDATPYDIVP